ncbi:MAG: AraC family transcriptional regulator [Planctomycetota bacterium]
MTQTDSSLFTYLPVTQIVDRLGMYVTGVGMDCVPPGADYPRQQHPELYDFNWARGRILPEFQFVFIESGSGEFESEAAGTQRVGGGSLMVLFPDEWHRYRPSQDTGWQEHWVSLGGDLLFQWNSRGLLSVDRPIIQLRHPEESKRIYDEMIELAMRSREIDALQLTACAMKVVASMFDSDESLSPILNQELASTQPSEASDDTIRRAQHMIWNHSHQRVSIDKIAKQIGVNRRTLERRFRDKLGRTILQELVNCRIQRAKRMLRDTQVPIKYVAYAAGFSSLSNLCKVFRREVDTTPGDYREKFGGTKL